ncbi:MAG: rhomboid family intramembrane serine protease [Myxococcales bacterium]|nr:rhomboid family intramembrane serine protease [Myxococcales bacterium]
MFFPIGHDRTVSGWPWVTIAIITACTLVQIYSEFAEFPEAELRSLAYEAQFAESEEEFAEVEQQAMELLEKIPAYRWGYHTDKGMSINAILSAFVHAGWLHLIGNMVFLWLAGSLLEDRWGRWRYLVFYGAGAFAATMCFKTFYDGGPTILVGASGAVSACLGGFLVHFHKAQIRLWYWFMFRFTGTFMISASVALPLWFADQLLWAYLQTEGVITGVAHTAHIGGFLFGVGIAIFGASLMSSSDEDEEAVLDLPAPDPMECIEERYQRCVAAIDEQDSTALRQNASRVVLDLHQQDDHQRILELYRLVAEHSDAPPFTDLAFAKIAEAADRSDSAVLYVKVASQLIAQHAGSRVIPPILWRVVEFQKKGGREDLALKTLHQLANSYSDDSYGARARDVLAART